MFSIFVESLLKGKNPDLVVLRKRFDLSLIKKMGVLNLPYHFWQSDRKINPFSAHMLWAAVFLEDRDGMVAVAEFTRKEMEEAQRYKKGSDAFGGDSYKNILVSFLDDLQTLVSENDLKTPVADKCTKAKQFLALT